MTLRLPAAAALAAALVVAAPATALGAEAFVGVTQGNVLVGFQSDDPADLEFERPITGLAAGDEVVGIDLRPATDDLLALGRQGRLYVLDVRTARARAVSNETLPLRGDRFGIDVNPAADRLRIVSNDRQNLRVNVDTFDRATDGDLAYAPGDPGAGSTPNVQAVAYTNNVRGAQSTQLFGIDNARGALVLQNPPNDGRLTTIGALGAGAGAVAFDIGTGNGAFAALVAAQGGTELALHRIDLATGRATPTSRDAGIRTQNPLVGLAAVGLVADDVVAPGVSVALSSTQLDQTLLQQGVRPSIACDEACAYTVTVTRNGATVGRATGRVERRAGVSRPTVPLNRATRTAIRRRNVLLRVRFEVRDGAGNLRTQSRQVRSQTLAERRGS